MSSIAYPMHTMQRSLPVERHLNLPNHSTHKMTICGLSLHQGNAESSKTLEQKSFNSVLLNPRNQRILLLQLTYSYHDISTNDSSSTSYKNTHNPQSFYSLWRRANARKNSHAISSLWKLDLSACLIPNFRISSVRQITKIREFEKESSLHFTNEFSVIKCFFSKFFQDAPCGKSG